MLNIFISYRRQDTPGEAGRIHDRLCVEYGPDRVFLDVDRIPPGADFVSTLEEEVSRADLMLVVIGREWLGATGVLVQRMFVPADRVIALGIYCRYCILRHQTLTELNSFSGVTMLTKPKEPRLPLPKGWPRYVQESWCH